MLQTWQFTPLVTLGLLLVACVYGRGMRQRSHAPQRGGRSGGRHVCFFAGLLTLYAALQSPLDFIADHLFFVHQIQHLILMMIAPILLLAPAPEGDLTAGLPSGARRFVLAPIIRNRAFRAVMRTLTHPCTATALCGGILYFWMIPKAYDAALANEHIHDLMHFCLLFGGLLFWKRVLEQRRPPLGTSYLARAGMLKVNLMMVAALGGYLTSTPYPLYQDNGFALFDITTIVDQQIGGAILWFVGSAILLAAIAIMIRKWLVETERIELADLAKHLQSLELRPQPDGDSQGSVSVSALAGHM